MFDLTSKTNVQNIQAWREEMFSRMILLMAVLTLPVIVLDFVRVFWQGYGWDTALIPLVAYSSIVGIGMIPRLAYAVRVGTLFGIGYLTCLYLLSQFGLSGSARIYLMGLIIFGALLMPMGWALVNWIAGGIILLAGILAMRAGLLPLAAVAVEELTDLPAVLISSIVVLSISAMVIAIIGSLVHLLDRNMRAAEAANKELELRVVERTQEFEALLEMQHEEERRIARQLQFAQALAEISRLMLACGPNLADYRRTLNAVAQTLLAVIEGDRVAFYIYPTQTPSKLARAERSELLVAAQDPTLPPHRMITLEENIDFPDVIEEMMERGECFNGPIAGRFPQNPAYSRYLKDNQFQALLYIPLFTDGYWWGHVGAADFHARRVWPKGDVQFLRTAGQIILTFVRGWQAAQDAQTRETLLNEVGAIARFGGWELDLQTLRLTVSEQIYRILELPPDKILTLDRAFGLFDSAAERQIRAAVDQCAQNGLPWDLELPVVTHSGRRLFVRIQGRPVHDDTTIRRLHGTCQDVTAYVEAQALLIQAKEAAEAADRAKSSFLAMMSHEIRTPLNAVIGMTSLLGTTELTPEQDEYVAIVRTSSNALLTLINDMLDLSRIESGHLVLEQQPFNLIDCLQEAVDLVTHQAAAKGLTLQLGFATVQTTCLYGDLGRIRQIVTNLLSNAIKFTAQGAVRLEAAVHPTPDGACRVAIAVHDTGIGIPPDKIEAIFQPFVQADASTTRRFGGTGLGLAISRQLAMLMGGSLQATSALGVGSTFTLDLVLPRAKVQHTAPLLPAWRPPPLQARSHVVADAAPIRLRVLIAEDNSINLQVTSRLVAQLGYVADHAANGVEAIDAVLRQRYDVILMDIQMPELDGEQAARQIRALGSLIRQPYIIALTALTLPHGHTQALDAGMNDYLHKPIQLEALRAALNRTPLPPNAVDPMIDEQQAPLLDWQALDAVACSLADDRQAVQTTVHALFVGELAGQIDALNMADIGDRARIAALAHRIRGGSHQLGALRLVAWCTALEHQAVTAEPELIDRLRAQIRRTFQQTLDLAQERYGAPIRK